LEILEVDKVGDIIKIAASSCCWWHDSLEDVLRKAHECGFTDIELLTFPPEIFPLHGNLLEMSSDDLKHQLEDYELKLAALHLGAIMTSSEDRRRKLTDYAKRAIEVASEIGCRIIVEGGPDRQSEPFKPFLKSLEELVPILEGTEIKIGLENHYRNWIQYIQDYEHIFQHVDAPSIGITIDTGHFTSAGVDPAEVAMRFKDRIYHVHIKDHIGTQSVALGTGQTNNFGMVKVLKESGYSGYLSQELEIEDRKNADRTACEGLKYMQKLCAI
jgi:sugar phosphate isomerase/epimerase